MSLLPLFSKLDTLRVAVLGDFCLDMYWHADMRRSVLSRETPHFPLPVVKERFSPGGAGNVACCAQALNPLSVQALGIIGQDWRGELLLQCLHTAGVDTKGLLALPDRFTNTYIKPLRQGISELTYEDPRIDFENFTSLEEAAQEQLIDALHALSGVDVLLVCDQMAYGCVTEKVRKAVEKLAAKGLPVVVDSRQNAGVFRHAMVKPNRYEAAQATGEEDMERAALQLSQTTGKPAVVTLGAEGCLLVENGVAHHIPAVQVPPPHDYVGAGDAFMAAFSLAAAAGEGLQQACTLGNAAAAVVIQKLNTTGTATRQELEAIW